jgi:hypothetical protein
VLTTKNDSISECSILPPIANSDHNVVLFSTPLESVYSLAESSYQYMIWNKANFDALNMELSCIDWNYVFQFCFNVHDCWCAFENIIFDACSRHVPISRSSTSSSSKKFRYPRYVNDLLKYKLVAWRRWKLSNLESDKLTYNAAKNQCSAAIKKFFAAKELELIRSNNLNRFYKFVNKKLTNNSSIGDIRDSNGCKVSDNRSKCEVFNNYFASVFTNDNNINPLFTDRVDKELVHLNSIDFSPNSVYSILKKMKSSNSCGPDNIPNVFLKNCASTLCLPLSHMFDISFKDGSMPDIWKSASVMPLFKKGSTSDPSNYRPISLTSNICKVMEKMINKGIQEYIFKNKLITSDQHGFLSKRSTCSNLLECTTDWSNNIDKGYYTDIIYFDFRKAFDSVSHPKLISKISAYGISGQLLEWLGCFLSKRKQFVKIGNAFSGEVPVTSGVPQGSVLGPTLFLLFINDLCDGLSFDAKVRCKLFADDLKIYASRKISSANGTIEVLHNALRHIESWCELWQLRLAIDKCQVIHVGRCKLTATCDEYMLYNQALSVIENVKDLGVIVDKSRIY